MLTAKKKKRLHAFNEMLVNRQLGHKANHTFLFCVFFVRPKLNYTTFVSYE